MTDKAEFERLLDVYGFRCERFGQDLSTHARAQVVSAFAALASAPVAGEAQPVCWIEKDVLESVRDEGSDAWVYWRPAGHVAEPDEMPLYAAPQASAEDVRELPDAEMRTLIGNYFADDWAKEAAAGLLHDYARALKQPQADKDGGQQRAGDVVRDALWTLTEHNALHFGEQHSTVIQGRAALSAPQAEQGERDE